MRLSNKKVLWITFATTFVLLLFVYSCATLQIPEPSERTESILIIPISSIEGASLSTVVRYRVYLEGIKETFMVYPQHKYKMITELKPGDYKIIRIECIYQRVRGGKSSEKDVNIEFNLKSGHITILPAQFWTKMTKKYQYWDIIELSDSDREKLISELSKDEKFRLWKINTDW